MRNYSEARRNVAKKGAQWAPGQSRGERAGPSLAPWRIGWHLLGTCSGPDESAGTFLGAAGVPAGLMLLAGCVLEVVKAIQKADFSGVGPAWLAFEDAEDALAVGTGYVVEERCYD